VRRHEPQGERLLAAVAGGGTQALFTRWLLVGGRSLLPGGTLGRPWGKRSDQQRRAGEASSTRSARSRSASGTYLGPLGQEQ